MNTEHHILIDESHGWRMLAFCQFKVWVKGNVANSDVKGACNSLDENSEAEDFKKVLSSFHGHFALVICHANFVCAAVDRIRSIPLVWTGGAGGRLHIAQEGRKILAALESSQKIVDLDQALAVALAGYTIGDGTLYKNIKALLPGTFLLHKNGHETIGHYHCFVPWKADQSPGNDGLEKGRLAELTLEILQELIDNANGRTIALPLSAGLDSRLIAAGLKHLGYENVVCFAYGRVGNHEAETSRVIAERLGYPWHFVPFSNNKMANIFRSEDYAEYKAYADSLTGVHFPQDYLAITSLLADGHISKDCLLVNGQSGDFISGNHIPASMESYPSNLEDRKERIVDALIAKHFKQWHFLIRKKTLLRIRGMLRAELSSFNEGSMPNDPQADYGLYEASEFVDRQSKYVVNGQRLYEYLDIDWALPLWHDRYLEYWAKRPATQKLRQRLYREMLMEENWGGVWRDVPVNAKNIRPQWLIPARYISKIIHAPFGKTQWHKFERRVFKYLMSPLCSYAVRSWYDIASDQRGPWTGLSPHIEDYLLDHSVDINVIAEDVAA